MFKTLHKNKNKEVENFNWKYWYAPEILIKFWRISIVCYNLILRSLDLGKTGA